MSKKTILQYDIIIIGGGLAGLYMAYYAKQKNPDINILILETKNRIGGRIKTIYHTPNVVFEAGAARIAKIHTNLLHLLGKLKLSHKLEELESYNKDKIHNTDTQITDLIEKSKKKSKMFRVNNSFKTAGKILSKNVEEIINQNGYNTNMEYQSLENYINYYHNISNNNLFYKLKGGLTQICNELVKRIGDKNIIMNCTLNDFEYDNDCFELHTTCKNIKTIYYSTKLILAIPKASLLCIPALHSINNFIPKIKSVHETKYIRIYAQYPVIRNKVWFYDLPPRITTPTIARQIIPVDRKNGIIEIYCDGQYASQWHDIIVNKKLEETFQKCMKDTFKDYSIPNPIFVLPYYWKAGSHFWKKKVDSSKIEDTILHPKRHLYICGEAYSKHQAWMEGCLQSVHVVYKDFEKDTKPVLNYKIKTKKRTLRKSSTTFPKSNKKGKGYTLEEVSKHATEKDAWISYKGIVCNITDWIPRHPGGNVILKGIGKDISNMFDDIGHSKFALKKLKEYQIGYLK
jgi:cytochrome b involved in lipid metabolism